MKYSSSQRRWLICALICVVLATTSAILIDLLLTQWRPTLSLNRFFAETALSERSLATLAETAGVITVVSILPSDASAAVPVGQLLRRFEIAALDCAGAEIEVSYIDPRVNPQDAARMMAFGAQGTGILLRQAGRNVFIPEHALLAVDGSYSPADAEEAIAAAFARLSRTDGVQIGWLTGHGEPDFSSTDPHNGYSGFRRALENEGCRVQPLTLPANATIDAIPQEISALAIVAPRYPITAAERTLLSDWLDRGGRILCFLPPGSDGGLAPLLEQWGVRIGATPRFGQTQTASGASVATLLDSTHPVTTELADAATVIFDAPKLFYAFDVRGIHTTALVRLPLQPLYDRHELTHPELGTVLIAAERGSNVGDDLGFRPGRLIVGGDAAFVSNRYVLNHASANRDLAINAVRWLTGLSGSGARGASSVLTVGIDRQGWQILFVIMGALVPLAICGFIRLLTWRSL